MAESLCVRKKIVDIATIVRLHLNKLDALIVMMQVTAVEGMLLC